MSHMDKKNVKELEYDCTLSELRDTGASYAVIAKQIGVTRDAVRQMLVYGRDIYLKEIDGVLHYCELTKWKHNPDKGINRLTGKRAPKPKSRHKKPLRKKQEAA